ncbi:MAG TPA: GGDEF domain-containing protein, partial [Acidobacteriaceae bacterium]
IDDGIGGKTARLAAPFAVFLPFALATIRGLVTRSNMIPEQYGVALASALLTFLAFCFILFLSSRCKQLESANRELSLRDQLTQLYNRRGFYILAEQALRLAYRAGDTFFVLYLDMDNLKQINDSLGHNVGSCLLQEMAVILQATFRETDIIGRLGGDEFAVAGTADHENFMLAITRLKAAAYTANCIPSRTYPLSFSLGYVPSSSSTETLEALLHQADSFMYAAKRGKKQLRTSPA